MAQDVIVYSNMGCAPCHQAMEYLSQKGVPFIEKNVARDPSAMQALMSMGLRLLPVLVIGDKRLSGFNPKEIDALPNDQTEAARARLTDGSKHRERNPCEPKPPLAGAVGGRRSAARSRARCPL